MTSLSSFNWVEVYPVKCLCFYLTGVYPAVPREIKLYTTRDYPIGRSANASVTISSREICYLFHWGLPRCAPLCRACPVAPGDGTGVEFRSADSPEVIFNWGVFHWPN